MLVSLPEGTHGTGIQRVFHLEVLLHHTNHKKRCAPAIVMSQLLDCEHADESAKCFSAYAYLNQDANTWGQKKVLH